MLASLVDKLRNRLSLTRKHDYGRRSQCALTEFSLDVFNFLDYLWTLIFLQFLITLSIDDSLKQLPLFDAYLDPPEECLYVFRIDLESHGAVFVCLIVFLELEVCHWQVMVHCRVIRVLLQTLNVVLFGLLVVVRLVVVVATLFQARTHIIYTPTYINSAFLTVLHSNHGLPSEHHMPFSSCQPLKYSCIKGISWLGTPPGLPSPSCSLPVYALSSFIGEHPEGLVQWEVASTYPSASMLSFVWAIH